MNQINPALPAVGGSDGVWGAILNGALQTIINQVNAQDSSGGRLAADGDFTAAVAAMTANSVLTLTPGATYTLSGTAILNVANGRIEGNGATVRLAANVATVSDRVIEIVGTGCVVRGLTIASRASGVNSIGGGWHVKIAGQRNTVESCIVTNAVPTSIGQASIGVSDGNDHIIRNNYISGGGSILAGWYATNRVRVENNLIVSSTANGIGHVGDDTNSPQDCVIRNNMIVSAARFGIEDYRGTRAQISGNTIVAALLMGMSLVGSNVSCVANRIHNSGSQQSLELAPNGALVADNEITYDDTVTTGTGIIVNGGAGSTTKGKTGITLANNRISNAAYGIAVVNTSNDVVITGGSIRNCNRGISVDGASDSLLIDGVSITFTVPYSGDSFRDGITHTNAGSAGLLITGCRITFSTASAGGTADDYFIRLAADGVNITNCVFNGSGRTDSLKPKVGSSYNPSFSTGFVANNVFRGGAVLQTSKFASTSQLVGNYTQS